MDADLNLLTRHDLQDSLFNAVQKSYDHLVVCFKQDLHLALPDVLKFTPRHDFQASEDQESVGKFGYII